MLGTHLKHSALTYILVAGASFSWVEKKGTVGKLTVEDMGMSIDDHLAVCRHEKGEMHQLELGFSELEVVGFLDQVVVIMQFMQMGIVVAIDSDIMQSAVFELF